MIIPHDGITLTDTEIFLTKDCLGVLLSAEEIKTRLIELINAFPAVHAVWMEEFPFPPEIILEIHQFIETCNLTRATKITVTSDFTQWCATQPAQTSALGKTLLEFCWFFERWEESKKSFSIFDHIHTLLKEYIETDQPQLKSIISQKLYTTNAHGNSLAFVIMKHTSIHIFNLLNAADPDEFFEHIQPFELDKKTAAKVIFHPNSPIRNRNDLAYSLADKHYDIPHEKCEIKALIAKKRENNLAKAAMYYKEAIEHGSIKAYYNLSVLVETNEARLALLRLGAQKGCRKSMHVLADIYEQHKMLIQSYHYLEMIEDIPEKQSHPAIVKRNQFYAEIYLMVEAILTRSLNLRLSRYPQALPGLSESVKKRFYKELVNTLYPTAWKTLLTGVGPGLLKRYLKNENEFVTLTKVILEHMHSESLPNQGLLSMDPKKFSEALNRVIVQHYIAQLPLREQSNERCSRVKVKYQ